MTIKISYGLLDSVMNTIFLWAHFHLTFYIRARRWFINLFSSLRILFGAVFTCPIKTIGFNSVLAEIRDSLDSSCMRACRPIASFQSIFGKMWATRMCNRVFAVQTVAFFTPRRVPNFSIFTNKKLSKVCGEPLEGHPLRVQIFVFVSGFSGYNCSCGVVIDGSF